MPKHRILIRSFIALALASPLFTILLVTVRPVSAQGSLVSFRNAILNPLDFGGGTVGIRRRRQAEGAA
jgi:hypothetical protein